MNRKVCRGSIKLTQIWYARAVYAYHYLPHVLYCTNHAIPITYGLPAVVVYTGSGLGDKQGYMSNFTTKILSGMHHTHYCDVIIDNLQISVVDTKSLYKSHTHTHTHTHTLTHCTVYQHAAGYTETV